ncbi:beta-lactamase-like protein [Chytridium lagenaria]|nr:beta-lactamase-like protein [Chytridium lagenaria]
MGKDQPVRRYTLQDMQSSFSKITTVRFNESVSLGPDLRIQASSSGFGLGACFWTITRGFERVVYISSSTLSGSRHSCVFDKDSAKNADVVLISDVAGRDLGIEKSIGTIYAEIARAMEVNRYSLIFPVSPFGIIFDLIELVNHSLSSTGKISVPIHFISGVAKECVYLGNILSEWYETFLILRY